MRIMKLKGYFSIANKFKLPTILPLLLSLLLSVYAQGQVGVVINEINYRSVETQENIDFVELYNASTSTVSLTGWQLTDGITYQFSAGTSISAGGYLVVCANPAECQSKFGFSGAYGPFAGALSSEADEVILRNASFKVTDKVDYDSWKEWPNVRYSDYETTEPIPQNTAYTQTVTQKVAISIQKINPNLDGKHGGSWGAGTPTPGAQNVGYTSNYTALPVIKDVTKSPDRPMSGEVVRIKADFENHTTYAADMNVQLEYQAMDAGSYITKSSSSYASNWTTIQMLDNGVGTDSTANNGIYTAEIPASVQQHRRLVRYRVKVTTNNGFSKIYPDQNHTESNYAYYVYNGHANFNGYNFDNIEPMQDLTVITTRTIADTYIGNGTNNSGQYGGNDYLGEGTIVYNGKVYDHVRFRPRGKTRAPRVKPGVKFDMNSERKIQLVDDCGDEYDVPRGKLQLSGTWVNDAASHGLVESLVYKILELTGGMYKYNDYTSLRIVDRTTETGNTGDFWGLYLIQEDYNGDLLKEHDLPDGNNWATYDPPTGGAAARFLYVDSYGDFPGAETQQVWINQPRGVNYDADANTVDKDMFYGDWIANEFWANGENNYYGKHSYREYYNPETQKWIGFCKDYDGAFGSGNVETSPVHSTLTANPDAVIRQPLTIPSSLQREYEGELRSAYDLLLNQEQSDFLVDSELKKIYKPSASYDWTTLDNSRWGTYQTYPEGNVDAHFQFYKNWFQSRANYLLNDGTHGIADNNIPNKPTISLTGSPALDNLTFSSSNFSDPNGSSTFAALEWRVGEWSDPSNPVYDGTCDPKYEIETKWKSGEITSFSNNFTFPADAQLKLGRTYKFRVRYKDTSGRWSHWSNPVTLVTTPAANTDYDLVINEIMYNDGGDCCGGEYVEIYNTGNNTILLDNFKFTDGVNYDFPKGTSISANDYLVLAKDSVLFVQKYGFSPFADYGKSLSDSGENIVLEGPYRVFVDSVHYDDGNAWDENPDGNGTSLELLNPDADNAQLVNWFRSDVLCGTPGAANTRICTGTAESIVINEINYNSNNGSTDPGDWVELYNPGNTTVDISGWEFYNEDTIYTIPTGTTIAPDDYLVLVEDPTMFSAIFPHLTTPDRYIGGFSFGLSGKGERISLFDENKCLSDHVDYDDEIPWAIEADGNGPTLSLITPVSDNVLPQSWESSGEINSAFGTPGRENTPCPESNIVIPESICVGYPITITVDNRYSDMNYRWILPGATPDAVEGIGLDSVEVVWNTSGSKFVQLFTTYEECAKPQLLSIMVDCDVSETLDTPEDNMLSTNISGTGNGTTTTLISDVANGTLTLNVDGSFDYEPDADFNGSDQFIYEMCSGELVIDTTITTLTQTVEVQVNNSNDDAEEEPNGAMYYDSSDLEFMTDNNRGEMKAVGLRFTNVDIPQGANITNAYLQFIADEADDVATSLTVSAEAIGNAAVIDNVLNNISTKPRTNNTVAWNNLPTWVIGTAYDTPDMTPVIQELTDRNDWTSGSAMTFIIEGAGQRVAESYDGVVDYAPKLFIDYETIDTVITVISDTELCTTSIIEINVTPVNDNPIAVDDSETTDEDNAVSGEVLPNDSDVENDTLSVNTTPIVAPASGSLVLNADGTYTYTPNANFNGTDTFEYEVCDDGTPAVACDTASVTITIDSVNDTPVANLDIYNINEDTPLSDSVLANDNDVENGNLTVTAPPVTSPSNGTLTLYADGTFDYTPNADFYGVDTFTYEVCDDGIPVECTTATVDINVIAVNDAPIAVNDVETTDEETAISGNVINNDINVDGDNLTANTTFITQPANGDAFILASGLYSYTPDNDFVGTDAFEYEVCDNGNPALCDTAMVNITVINVNDAPLATADTFYMVANTILETNLITNDSDPENDQLIMDTAPASSPPNGTLNMQSNGDIDYTPDPGYTGTVTFSYEVCDDGTPAECTIAEVTVVVELDCINVQMFAWMEGAYEQTIFEMRNTLNATRGLLPGQTPISNLATPTPAGQPYNTAPWNYTGTEGATWTDADYIPDMVDWVLLSFRTDKAKSTQVAQTAGIIHRDGSITLPDRCGFEAIQGVDSVYVLLEHRNHMGIMTPEKIEIVNGTLTYDFRTSDSFRDITSFGQKQLPTGEWAMYAGDVNQTADIVSYDINGQDKSLWVDDNGIFDNYLNTDFNLDGDTNGQDKALWFDNNGISSRVPK